MDGLNESKLGPANLRMVEYGYVPVDALDDQVKVVDNQIDVLTKAFQGITVSCPALPRPQVRSHHASGFLCAIRHLRKQPTRHGRGRFAREAE